MAIIVIITKASVSSLESSCFSTYSGAPQGHHVIFPAKGPPPCPLPHIYHCYISYINISLLHRRWDEQCRDTMMTVPPQLTSSLPSFSYPASFRHPPPASSHSRLQNLPSSSFVLGDPVGQWARNLGAWHDTRTGGTRWDVLNLTTWWCWPSKGMQSDANMILINLWNSLNFHICISLNHFCGPYSCKMYQTNVVNSC